MNVSVVFDTWRIKALLIAFVMFIASYFWHAEQMLEPHWNFFMTILCAVFGILFVLIAVSK